MTFDRRDRHGFFIDGALREPTGSERVEVIHPGNEEAVGSIPKATPDDMAAAVAAARRAFDEGPWPHTAPAERAEMLSAIADGLEKRLEELAWLSTAQNGMPITLARQSQGIEILRYYADIARDVVWEERRQGLAGTGLTGGGGRSDHPVERSFAVDEQTALSLACGLHRCREAVPGDAVGHLRARRGAR